MTSTVASNLTGMVLAGKKSNRKWTVGEMISVPVDRSQPNFSVGYHVTSDDGVQAFLKATDLGLLTHDGGSVYDRVRAAMDSHGFERSILDHCRSRSMDKVVVAIDYGDAMVTFGGVQDALFYLVFELAKYDLRKHYDKTEGFALSWALGAMHQLAVGVSQLHDGQVTHNDIKPANFLVFADDAQKISDLGCATSPLITALHQDKHDPGDIKYAAPELLYAETEGSQRALCTFENRRAADLYNLGSMAFYLVTGTMLTPQVIGRLATEHRPVSQSGGWNGSWADAMPYWREAFARVISEASDDYVRDSTSAVHSVVQEVFAIIKQLCEPDATIRGHPLNHSGRSDRYGLERYISSFNRLRLRSLVNRDG
ncbi:protein kinase domain-containing protein [Sphingomonas sp. IC4-52]|uniref:protein kinase domain-containing protein n=1 Tax=Sphingomonas sp. IC4-52 TaxID=2887202 RepID=UPI001D10F2ED|nr:protein kinase [Sphingomonas sp. IC4-52]MCC2978891.1 protein kinase [Sphingomonas sp. IC4-52]